MRISIHPASVLTRAANLDEAFALLRRAGVEGIQFGMGGTLMPASVVRGHKPSVMDEPLERVIEVVRPYKEAADRQGVAITQVHAPFPMWAPGDEALAERMKPIMRKAVAVTGFMESPYCVIHPASPQPNTAHGTAEEDWEINHALFAALIPELKKYHVVALMENLCARDIEGVRFAGVGADFAESTRWLDLLNEEAGGEYFGFCLDTGHCQLARQNLYRAIHLLGGHLKALHLQDNSCHLDDHRAPYTGSIDWEGVLRALREIGYQGDLNFEAGTAINAFPVEMTEACVHMLALTGEYFRKRLSE